MFGMMGEMMGNVVSNNKLQTNSTTSITTVTKTSVVLKLHP